MDHGDATRMRVVIIGAGFGGIGLGVALGTWLLPCAATVMFTLFAQRTRIEEKFLIERFGTQYRDYMKRVGCPK